MYYDNDVNYVCPVSYSGEEDRLGEMKVISMLFKNEKWNLICVYGKPE